jgi:serine/threonine-protein kinase RsbT
MSMRQLEVSLIPVKDNEDIVRVRAAVRDAAALMGFSSVDQVRLVTAASELARNIKLYANHGTVELRPVRAGGRSGLRIDFEDSGPGIADLDLAMTDGYTTSRGMGKGLPGSRRLVDDFEIRSEVGKGTIVTITKWLH